MKNIIALLLCVICVHSFGAPTPSKTVDLTKAKSDVNFIAKLTVGGSINGKPDAEYLKKDPSPLKGELKISPASISGKAAFKLDSFDTGIGLRTRHMKEKYLQTAEFPEAELTLTEIKLPEGFTKETHSQDNIPFKGTLKLHGKQNPVVGTLKAERNKDTWDMSYQFPINIKEYGIEVPSYLGVTVKDVVDVEVKIKS